MQGGADQGTVLKLIRHAAVSGGLRAAAKEFPEAARGLNKAAAFHSARVGALADEIVRSESLAALGRRVRFDGG